MFNDKNYECGGLNTDRLMTVVAQSNHDGVCMWFVGGESALVVSSTAQRRPSAEASVNRLSLH